MPTPQQLDAFTLAFHRQAITRMQEQPQLVDQALQTLQRWQDQRGATASDPHLQRWKVLLTQSCDQIAAQVCQNSDEAATLRNVSPLGFVLSAGERKALRQQVMQ
jgi:uncharacterized membrane protein YcjF (UPF0283 family)